MYGESDRNTSSEELHSVTGNVEAEQTTCREMQQDVKIHPLTRGTDHTYSKALTVPLKPLPALLTHICILPVRYIPTIRYIYQVPTWYIDWLLILREKGKSKKRSFCFFLTGLRGMVS
jgi:hypothetical protein